MQVTTKEIKDLKERLEANKPEWPSLLEDLNIIHYTLARLEKDMAASGSIQEVPGNGERRWMNLNLIADDYFRALGRYHNALGQIANKEKALNQQIKNLGLGDKIQEAGPLPFTLKVVDTGEHRFEVALDITHTDNTVKVFRLLVERLSQLKPNMKKADGIELSFEGYEGNIFHTKPVSIIKLKPKLPEFMKSRSEGKIQLPPIPSLEKDLVFKISMGHWLPTINTDFMAALQNKPTRLDKAFVASHGLKVLDYCGQLTKSIRNNLPSQINKALEAFYQLVEDFDGALGEEGWQTISKEIGSLDFINIFISSKKKRRFITCDVFQQAYEKHTSAKIDTMNQEFACYLKSNTQRDFKREIIFLCGPTNSGKSYDAFNILCQHRTGAYLGPLRLLALEGQEEIRKRDHPCSPITGEEEDIVSGAQFSAQTVETFQRDREYECVVIDEIQMIGDSQRGPSFLEAFVAINAQKVVLTGSKDALPIIEKIATAMGDKVTCTEKERMVPLKYLPNPLYLDSDLDSGTAIIAFSRRSVLALRERLMDHGYSVSVIYGGLSPLSRRYEAERFRKGETEILVATDAIGMGLNLPIKTVLFAETNKFDGIDQRDLKPTEIIQIGGRAGRYNFKEPAGYVGVLKGGRFCEPQVIERGFAKASKVLKPLPSAWGSLGYNQLMDATANLVQISPADIITKLGASFEFENPWISKCRSKIQDMAEKAKLIEDQLRKLRLEERAIIDEYGFHFYYKLVNAPVDHDRPGSEFTNYIKHLLKDIFEQAPVETPIPETYGKITKRSMPVYEQTIKNLTAYYWFRNLLEKNFVNRGFGEIRSFTYSCSEILDIRDKMSLEIAQYLAR